MSKAFKKMMKQKEDEKLAEQLKQADLKDLSKIENKKKQNIFNMFQDDDYSDDDGFAGNDNTEDINPVQDEIESKKNKKKKRRKKRKKNKQKEKEDDFIIKEEKNLEEIEKSERLPVLSISKKKFNYNKELSKFFEGTSFGTSMDIPNVRKKDLKAYKQMLKKMKSKKKYYLVHNPDVLMKMNSKLDMKILSTKNQFKIFSFEPSKKFLNLQSVFESMRDTGDPNMLQEFLAKNPYYPEALYSMCEYFRLQGNFKEANFLMEKLIFSYEEAFVYDFKIFEEDLKQDNYYCILKYDENIFNQILFKALLKFIVILLKKSCYQTAFEFTKLLLRLSPVEDPMGALVMIDHTALIAKKYDWLLNFVQFYGETFINDNTSLVLYPNFLFSKSLALFEKLVFNNKGKNPTEDDLKIDKKIFENIFSWNWDPKDKNPSFWLALGLLLYPMLFKQILLTTFLNKKSCFHKSFDKSQKQSWSSLFDHPIFLKAEKQLLYPFLNILGDLGLQGLNKVISIYPERNLLIWKKDKINLWMKAVCGALIDFVEEKEEINLEKFQQDLLVPEGKVRSCLIQFTLPFEPKKHKNLLSKNFSDEEDTLDLNAIPDQQPAHNNANINPIDVNQNWLGILFNSLLPWNGLPEQNQNNNRDQDN